MREIKPTRQLIELIYFLRVTLLELTDVALLQSSRRSQQLFREAADKAQSNRVRGTTSLIQQAAKARSVLHDESKTWQARVLEARELLAELGDAAGGSFVTLVRKALAEDSQRARLPGGVEGSGLWRPCRRSGFRAVESLDGSAAPGRG
jgi:hypothetical protein